MQFVTVSKEFNDAEAQMKRARLEAAGFHVVIMNEASSIWMGTPIATGGILLQVPEVEAADAREFLGTPVK